MSEAITQAAAYDLIDRFLRNNLYDDDYAKYSEALEAISQPAPSPQPAVPVVSDEQIVAALESAGVKFQRFTGGISGTRDCWSTAGSQDVRKLAAGVRAILALRPAVEPMTAEQGPPTEPGLYAWVGVGNASLVLVNRRPSDSAPGGQLNGHVINSTRFYDGCAVADWGSDGQWVLLMAHNGITAKAEGGA